MSKWQRLTIRQKQSKACFDAYRLFCVTPIRACLRHDNFILRLFAIFDRRVGKRTLLGMKQEVLTTFPQWLQRFYHFRVEETVAHEKVDGFSVTSIRAEKTGLEGIVWADCSGKPIEGRGLVVRYGKRIVPYSFVTLVFKGRNHCKIYGSIKNAEVLDVEKAKEWILHRYDTFVAHATGEVDSLDFHLAVRESQQRH